MNPCPLAGFFLCGSVGCIAKRLIDASFGIGWDCVKFQKRNPDVCVPEHQKSTMRQTPWGEMTYLDYKYKVRFENEYCLL